MNRRYIIEPGISTQFPLFHFADQMRASMFGFCYISLYVDEKTYLLPLSYDFQFNSHKEL